MKKFTVTQAFSIMSNILMLKDDTFYAEEVGSSMYIYSEKTRKKVGWCLKTKFCENTKLTED